MRVPRAGALTSLASLAQPIYGTLMRASYVVDKMASRFVTEAGGKRRGMDGWFGKEEGCGGRQGAGARSPEAPVRLLPRPQRAAAAFATF